MSVLKRRALIGPLAVLLLLAACQTAGESPGAWRRSTVAP